MISTNFDCLFMKNVQTKCGQFKCKTIPDLYILMSINVRNFYFYAGPEIVYDICIFPTKLPYSIFDAKKKMLGKFLEYSKYTKELHSDKMCCIRYANGNTAFFERC